LGQIYIVRAGLIGDGAFYDQLRIGIVQRHFYHLLAGRDKQE
jgi:hypothetical protein